MYIHQCVLTDDECSLCAFSAFCALVVRSQRFGGCWVLARLSIDGFVEGCRSPLASETFETALNAMIFSHPRQKMTIVRETCRYLWSWP